MAIKINIQTQRSVPQVDDRDLTLVILKNAVPTSGTRGEVIKIDGYDMTTLLASFDDPTTLVQAQELYALEYLISSGVSVLAYPVNVVDTFDSTDVANVNDIDLLRYKFVVAPFSFIESGALESDLTGMVSTLGIDAQLFLDLALDTASGSIPDLGEDSPKIELFINTGYLDFSSQFVTTIDFSAGNESSFEGVPASLAALVRKAKLLRDETPWIPVAGEKNGLVSEFVQLGRELTTAEKTAFQAANINVLVSKVGVGNIFVSQNTMYGSEGSLLRSHAVTVALQIKRDLKDIAEGYYFYPNNQKTWDSVSLRLRAFLQEYKDSDGITRYSIAVGENVTMTAQDVLDGKMIVALSFLPISVIKDIVFNIVISETSDSYDVQISGGVL